MQFDRLFVAPITRKIATCVGRKSKLEHSFFHDNLQRWLHLPSAPRSRIVARKGLNSLRCIKDEIAYFFSEQIGCSARDFKEGNDSSDKNLAELERNGNSKPFSGSIENPSHIKSHDAFQAHNGKIQFSLQTRDKREVQVRKGAAPE